MDCIGPNRKVNRIKSGTDTGKYIRNVPITEGLRALLIELGMDEKKGSDEYVIPRNGQSTKYMMQINSRGFSHFIKLASARKVEFKDLRKTYITMMTKALGTSAKMFTAPLHSRCGGARPAMQMMKLYRTTIFQVLIWLEV